MWKCLFRGPRRRPVVIGQIKVGNTEVESPSKYCATGLERTSATEVVPQARKRESKGVENFAVCSTWISLPSGGRTLAAQRRAAGNHLLENADQDLRNVSLFRKADYPQ